LEEILDLAGEKKERNGEKEKRKLNVEVIILIFRLK